MVKHGDIDHTGITGVGGGGPAGLAPFAVIPSTDYAASAQFGAVGRAQMHQIIVPAPMKVRGLSVHVSATGSGTHEWGLFDASADATAATKICGGSGALSASNVWNVLAATGAPVDVAAGAYILIFKWPAANHATLHYTNISRAAGNATPFSRTWGSGYVWDDTPDLTHATWADDSSVFPFVLVGDMDASGNQW